MRPEIATSGPSRTLLLCAGTLVTAGLLVTVAVAGISMDLMLCVMTVVKLFTDSDVLPFQPDWTGMAWRLTGLAAAVAIGWGTLRYARSTRGACLRCGRVREGTGIQHRRARWWAAALSVPPALGYAALKLHWAFSGTIGLADETAFAGVGPTTPGFVDTALLALIGVGVTLLMAAAPRAVPRLVLLAPALIGCVLLVPAAALGMITLLSGSTSDSAALGGLAPWVLWFVYGCFTWWGAGLATTTALYWTDSRPRCARCGLR